MSELLKKTPKLTIYGVLQQIRRLVSLLLRLPLPALTNQLPTASQSAASAISSTISAETTDGDGEEPSTSSGSVLLCRERSYGTHAVSEADFSASEKTYKSQKRCLGTRPHTAKLRKVTREWLVYSPSTGNVCCFFVNYLAMDHPLSLILVIPIGSILLTGWRCMKQASRTEMPRSIGLRARRCVG